MFAFTPTSKPVLIYPDLVRKTCKYEPFVTLNFSNRRKTDPLFELHALLGKSKIVVITLSLVRKFYQ